MTIIEELAPQTTRESGPPRRPARAGRLARLGGWCARRRWFVVTAWGVLLVVGIVVGGQVFAHLKDGHGSNSVESVHGFNLLDAASTDGGSLVAVVDGVSTDDLAVRAAVVDAAGVVAQVPGVTSVVTAYDDPDPRLRAVDEHASLVVITTAKTDDMAVIQDRIESVRAALKDAVPGATVTVGGPLAVVQEQAEAAGSDLVRGEAIALPVLLLALLLVFRGVRSALIPVIGGLVTIAGALLLLRGLTGVMDIASYAVDVVALFGLALAVDYCLLMVNRFREERAAGHELPEAVSRTVAFAGRTITFSALIVMASLAGLFAFSDPTFSSLAVGGIATTLVALCAGLTLVPALLAVWGKKIKPSAGVREDDGAFARLARRVQRRPLLVAAGSVAALLAAGAPFLSVNFGQDDPRLLPRSFDSRTVADTLQTRFHGTGAEPVQVVAQRAASDPAVIAYAGRIRAIAGVEAVELTSVAPALSVVRVTPSGTTQGAAAQQLIEVLRDHRPSYPTYVTGSAAFLLDFKHSVATRIPWALGLIAFATFALLFLMTGSIMVPIKALTMNLLSLCATFGALVWVFQDGHLSGVLGFDAFGAIELWVPIVTFVFAFGLSMDYEVFLLSRIKEAYDETGDSEHAVAVGLQRSGRIITSAAGLVMIVFLGFALGQNLGIKEMGMALAIAVLVDATVVRCLLVPATMTLLGDANWWAPASLRRLHDRIGLREQPTVDASLLVNGEV
jgi:RND superfamily putative drug exporter